MTDVVFIQAKFPNNENSFIALVNRWGLYQTLFKTYTNGSEFKLFSINRIPEYRQFLLSKQSINEFIMDGANSFQRIKFARKKILNNPNQIILICGDNQMAFLTGLYLKYSTCGKVQIQTQFHGDTYSFFANKGFFGILRVIFSRLAIKSSNSIRVVSEFQIKEIEKFTKKSRQKFIIAPIPIDFSRIPKKRKDQNIDVLVVGRLHHERGINEMVVILKKLKLKYPSLKMAIVGDGPLSKYAEKLLIDVNKNNDIIFHGFLNPGQLLDIYARSKVLLSTAPSEGYGLTLREAALSSIFVVARDSKGVREAQEDFPNQILSFESTEKALELIEKAWANVDKEIDYSKQEMQKEKDLMALYKLFSSWVND